MMSVAQRRERRNQNLESSTLFFPTHPANAAQSGPPTAWKSETKPTTGKDGPPIQLIFSPSFHPDTQRAQELRTTNDAALASMSSALDYLDLQRRHDLFETIDGAQITVGAADNRQRRNADLGDLGVAHGQGSARAHDGRHRRRIDAASDRLL